MNIFKRMLHARAKDSNNTFSDPVVNLNCTEFEVNNWIISDFIVNHLVPIVGVHPFPLNELHLMVAAVCRLQPSHIFEWGTNIGKSARIFYEAVKSFKIATEIHSIDLPDDMEHVEHPKDQRGALVKDIKEVKLYTGDGLVTSFSIYKEISDRKNVLYYLDGDHSYDSVYRELSFITKKIPEASILLHDTFYQSFESGYNVGPHKAIKDVLLKVPDKYTAISTQTGLPGMTLLYNNPV